MTIGWHRADIKAAVEKKGKTLTQLAIDEGLEGWSCRHALGRRHRPGEMVIAEFIGVPVWELWPGRWRKPSKEGSNPTRIDNRFRKKSRTDSPCRHRQKLKAA
jgi:Ner family transcriptional regulator